VLGAHWSFLQSPIAKNTNVDDMLIAHLGTEIVDASEELI
jgi:hypothetical protein